MQIQIETQQDAFFNHRTKLMIYLSLAVIISMVFAIEDSLNSTSTLQVIIELLVCIPLFTFSLILFSFIAAYSLKTWRKIPVFQSNFYSDLFWTIIWVLVVAFIVFSLYKPLIAILPIDDNSMPDYRDFRWLIWSASFLLASTVMVVEHFWEVLLNRQQLELVNYHLKRNDELAKYKALVHQVNPHFLFNSLNALSLLVHENPKDAERFIEELAKIYRYILQLKDAHLVPLKRELEFIDSYIFLQKIRYQENLHFQSNINVELFNHLIPPLTLELLIENAIKHNSVGRDTPLNIEITAQNGYIIIQNKLQPRMEHEVNSTKVGLKNLLEKYSILGSERPAFFIENGHFIAKIPLLKPEE